MADTHQGPNLTPTTRPENLQHTVRGNPGRKKQKSLRGGGWLTLEVTGQDAYKAGGTGQLCR